MVWLIDRARISDTLSRPDRSKKSGRKNKRENTRKRQDFYTTNVGAGYKLAHQPFHKIEPHLRNGLLVTPTPLNFGVDVGDFIRLLRKLQRVVPPDPHFSPIRTLRPKRARCGIAAAGIQHQGIIETLYVSRIDGLIYTLRETAR